MAEKVQESWAESVAAALGSVASYDPSIRDKGQVSLKEEIKFFGNKFQESPESSSKFQVPYYQDSISKALI